MVAPNTGLTESLIQLIEHEPIRIFMKDHKAVVIPIKTRNQRLPGKNTRMLGGKPLYAYLFESVKQCKAVDTVYVDSSDESILSLAKEWGFRTIKRPESLNSDNTTGHDLLNFEFNHIEEEIIGQLFVTSPFLKSSTIDAAINMLRENHEVDSVFGVYPIYNRFWFKEKPVNHNPEKLLGTQYMEPLHCERTLFYA